MTREIAIKTAVKWWTDKLRRRSPHSNGDNGAASVFACLLADINAENIQNDKLDLFTTELENGIREAMTRNERFVWLGCDYGPDMVLRDAADKAGINYLNFPFKTNLCIEQIGDGYSVKVSDGYAQPYESVTPCEEGGRKGD